MRSPFLLTALVAAISGCTSPPKTVQAPAASWVDEQIAQSASAISLAQRQLHQTSAAPAPATGPVPASNKNSSAVSIAVPAAPAITTTSQAKTVTLATPPAKSPPMVTPAAAGQPQAAGVAAPKAAQASTTTSKNFSVAATQAPPPVVTTAVPTPKPPAPVSKPLPPPPVPKPVWVATVGDRLSNVISTWSERAKYTLDWQCKDLDYAIEAPLRFEGSFEEAVLSIFQLYDKAERSFAVDGRLAQHRLIVAEDHNKSKRSAP